ncbi:MAG: glycosyltransferase family 2 protein [Phycisphaerales bacterium]
MTALVDIAAFAVASVAAVGGAFWCVAAGRLVRVRRQQPSVRRGLELPAPEDGWPRISIVIPAHNEARIIEEGARALGQLDYPDYEVIFVLDRCTDATADLLAPIAAADSRMKVIHNDSCPDDWAGKCNAARVGAAASTGQVLVFTDADTAFAPELLRATVALAAHEDRQLVSLLSTLTVEHDFERRVQPVASIQLMNQYPIERVNRRDGPRPFANGQFMQFDRATYEKIGGHEAVHDDLLEDIAFARAVHWAGGSGAVYLADDMLRCSMYGTWEAFRAGWKRIFIEASRRMPHSMRKYAVRLALLGAGLPVVQALALFGAGWFAMTARPGWAAALAGVVIVGFIAQAWTLGRAYAMAGAPANCRWWWPLGCVQVARIQWEGASDLEHERPIRWGGREYVLKARRPGE